MKKFAVVLTTSIRVSGVIPAFWCVKKWVERKSENVVHLLVSRKKYYNGEAYV